MKKGETAHVTAHSFSLSGQGVAHLGDKTLLCSGLFPGESAQVRVTAVSRHHARAYATRLTLVEAHPARRPAPCENHEQRAGRCSGCALMELDEAAQREAKRTLLRHEFALEVAEVEHGAHSLGYRWASKRVVSRERGALILGSYARDSHEVASMRGCAVEHPLLQAAFDQLEHVAREERIEPFDERSGAGDLRYVWGKTNGSEVILTLITGHAESRAAERLPALLEGVSGVCRGIQGNQGNQMRGEHLTLLAGKAELSTQLLGQTVTLGALGFLQPNPEVAELAYHALTDCDDLEGPRNLAFDLYAGAGVTTRRLAQLFARVVPCEAYPESAHNLGVEPRDAAVFLEEALAAQQRPDLVIANPPRKGLGPVVCERLMQLASPELRIMSCGPEGLARDLVNLAQTYELVSLRAFDTLPQTPHIELVAQLRLRTHQMR